MLRPGSVGAAGTAWCEADELIRALVAAVRAEIRALDRSAPITEMGTIDEQIGESFARDRMESVSGLLPRVDA
jgi:hypothetical protein